MIASSLLRPAGAVLVFALTSVGLHAQAVGTLDQAAWEAVNNKIIQKIQGVDTTLLQQYAIHLTSTPLYAMWDQGEDGTWEFLNVADQIPNWGPTWAPSGRRFSREYLKFATAVAIRTRTDVNAKDLDRKADDYLKAQTATRTEFGKLLAEWDTYQRTHRSSKLDYDDWLDQVSIEKPKYKAAVKVEEAAYTAWSNLLSPEDQSIGVFKKNMTEYDPRDNSKNKVRGEYRYPYSYAAASLQQLKKDGDAAWNNKAPVFSFDSMSDTTHRAEERTSWGAGASYGSFFSILKVGASAQGEHYSLNVQTQSSSFTYAAYAFGFISLEPSGNWFSGELIDTYKDKDRAFLPVSPVSYATLWGPKGSLNLQPVGVIVAYRPQITAHMSASQINHVKDVLSAGGSVSWGPFSFGGSYTKTSETYDAHADKGDITVSSQSPYPYVIAVLSRRLNYVGAN